MNIDVATLHRGSTPLLVSFPHVGTGMPADIGARLVPHALEVEDTDWHLEALYAFVGGLAARAPSCRAFRAIAST